MGAIGLYRRTDDTGFRDAADFLVLALFMASGVAVIGGDARAEPWTGKE